MSDMPALQEITAQYGSPRGAHAAGTSPIQKGSICILAAALIALQQFPATAENLEVDVKALARLYVADTAKGGAAQAIESIEDCYNSAAPRQNAAATRRCMTLDLAAYTFDGAMANTLHQVRPLIPYFDLSNLSARFERYGPVAKFRNPQEALAFLKPRADAVLTEVARLRQSQNKAGERQ